MKLEHYLMLVAALGAVAADLGLMWLTRRYWARPPQASHDAARTAQPVYFLGQYSPLLTWWKHASAIRAGAEPATPLAGRQLAVVTGDAAGSQRGEAPHAEGRPPMVAIEEPAAARPVPQASPAAAHRNLALALVALGLAFIGQLYFSQVRDDLIDGAGFFAAAIVLFLLLMQRTEPVPVNTGALRGWYTRVRDRLLAAPLATALALMGLALAYTTVRLLNAKTGATSYWDVFALWVLSWVCYAAAFVRPPQRDWRLWWQTYQKEVALAGVLTLLALGLRLVRLGQWPNVISGDEGAIGSLVLDVMRGHVPNMMATITGQNTLYLYLIAGFMRLLGVSPFALRLAAALGGTLTVPLVYILGRRLFNARVALVAASLIAVANFHVHFSRIIVATSIQDALFAVSTLYFFYTGLQQRSATRLTLAGLSAGGAMFIYMGARLLLLMLPVYLLCLLVFNRKLVLDNLGNLLAFAGAVLVMAAPIINFAVTHADEFNARANQVGIFQSGWLAHEVALTGRSAPHIILDLIRQAFLTVNYYPSYGFHYSPMPMLDMVTGALFMLGVAYSLYRLADRLYLLLNGWFWSGVVVGGAMVVLPSTSAYRILIVFPVVCLFVGLAWDKLMTAVAPAFGGRAWLQRAPTLALIAVFATLNFKAYFIDYAASCKYEDVNTRLASRIGQISGELGRGYRPYLVTAPRLLYGVYQSMDFFNQDLGYDQFLDPLIGPPAGLPLDSPMVFFFTPERESELAYVQSAVPGGQVEQVLDCGTALVTVYAVPAP